MKSILVCFYHKKVAIGCFFVPSIFLFCKHSHLRVERNQNLALSKNFAPQRLPQKILFQLFPWTDSHISIIILEWCIGKHRISCLLLLTLLGKLLNILCSWYMYFYLKSKYFYVTYFCSLALKMFFGFCLFIFYFWNMEYSTSVKKRWYFSDHQFLKFWN